MKYERAEAANIQRNCGSTAEGRAKDYTLNVSGKDEANQGTITNFDTALTNNGTLNVSNIKFENNNKDIVNAGTLNLAGANTLFNGIEGSGRAF